MAGRFNWIINRATYRQYRSDLELSSRRPNDPPLLRSANSREMLRSSRRNQEFHFIVCTPKVSDRSCSDLESMQMFLHGFDFTKYVL